MGKAVVERVPEVADAAGFGAWHAEAVLEGSEVSGKWIRWEELEMEVEFGRWDLPLGRRTAVVVQVILGPGAVGLIVIQVS